MNKVTERLDFAVDVLTDFVEEECYTWELIEGDGTDSETSRWEKVVRKDYFEIRNAGCDCCSESFQVTRKELIELLKNSIKKMQSKIKLLKKEE